MLPEILKPIIEKIKNLIKACLTYLFLKAVLHNKPFYVQLLLKLGADVNGKDRYGNTALHLTCQHKLKDIFDLLLITPKVNINCFNHDKKLAAALAADEYFNYAADELIALHKKFIEAPIVFNPKKRRVSKKERKDLKKQVNFLDQVTEHTYTPIKIYRKQCNV